MSRHVAVLALAISLCLLANLPTAAQQVTTSTPSPNGSHGFSEVIGFTGSLSGPGFSAHWGGFPTGLGQPGGATGGGLQGGFGLQGGGFNAGLGFMAAQGSNAVNGMQSASVTTMNGYGGSVSDTSQSPFVISGGVPWQQQVNGVIPRQPGRETSFSVVPSQSVAAPPRNSAAQSVAQIRREQQALEQAQQQEAQVHLERGRAAVADGKPGVARVYYQMALRRATGDLKSQVQEELNRLGK